MNSNKAELEKSIKDLSDSIKDTVKEEVIKCVDQTTVKLKKDIEDMTCKYRNLESENQKLKADLEIWCKRIIDNEDRSRRLNLVIDGIMLPEGRSYTKTVNQFFIDTMEVPSEIVEDFRYRAVHPLGPVQGNGTGKLIVAFTNQDERDMILSKASILKGKPISVKPNYSRETAKHKDNLMVLRKTLISQHKAARVIEHKYYPTLQVKGGNGRWKEYDPAHDHVSSELNIGPVS